MSKKDLDEYGAAIDTYKCIMNTDEYRRIIIKMLVKEKSVDFIGSYMVFDPSKEDQLETFYAGTTEGQREGKIISDLSELIKKSKKKYMCFTMGSIINMDNVCHHVGFLIHKTKKMLVVKMINSGLLYLPKKYGVVLENTITRIGKLLKLETTFLNPYMRLWLGVQGYNPQDYCKGGIIGELYTLIDKRMGIHRESYCQTWCIMMMVYEIRQICKRGYDICNNYFTAWKDDKKALEIAVREFALAIVKQVENKINFLEEFRCYAQLSKTPKKKFSKILLESFQNLHSEIQGDKSAYSAIDMLI